MDAGTDQGALAGTTEVSDVQRLYNSRVDELDEAFERLGRGAEAIVATPVCWDRGQAVADAHRIPMAIVYPFPTVPTGA